MTNGVLTLLDVVRGEQTAGSIALTHIEFAAVLICAIVSKECVLYLDMSSSGSKVLHRYLSVQ